MQNLKCSMDQVVSKPHYNDDEIDLTSGHRRKHSEIVGTPTPKTPKNNNQLLKSFILTPYKLYPQHNHKCFWSYVTGADLAI